jgi:flagella basal body P-ring formation protein FlgA
MRSGIILPLTLAAALAHSSAVSSAGRQDASAIVAAVERFVRAETAGLPGQVNIHPGPIDPRLNLPACPEMETFLPPGTRLWGRASVGVRCNAPVQWTVFVPVSVEVIADVVYAVKPLVQGQSVGPDDIATRKADLTRLPPGILTDLGEAVGKVLAGSIASGQWLRRDLLRSPSVIQQGQVVRLLAEGRGFRVTSEGRALAAAAAGQVVPVRTASGQIVSGIARPDATVEVRP